MRWLDKLEARFGKLGIPNLIMYVVAGRVLAWLLTYGRPELAAQLLLDPAAVMRGEAWRLVTFVFVPPLSNPLFDALALYFTFLVGRILESYWGTFRFTLFYLIGTVGTASVAFIPPGAAVSPFFLDTSLFLAFATLFPDFTVLLFFVLPVKVKYLGWLSAAMLTFFFWTTNLTGKFAITIAFTNYLVFFAPQIREAFARSFRRIRGATAAPLPADRAVPPPAEPAVPVHRCSVCGATEKTRPDEEFRWCNCRKCGEGREFCSGHLAAHRKA